ncbi:MAG: hypothetical protein NVSMB46_09500 [Candidatus Saccharimonadales bacterium]
MKIKHGIFLIYIISVLFGGLMFSSKHAQAYNLFGAACDAKNTSISVTTDAKGNAQTPTICNTNTNQNPIVGNGKGGIFVTIANVISFFAGIAAVIIIIIAGLQYILSNGDNAKVSSAKNTILYAIIGLVVITLAQTIIRFTIGRL